MGEDQPKLEVSRNPSSTDMLLVLLALLMTYSKYSQVFVWSYFIISKRIVLTENTLTCVKIVHFKLAILNCHGGHLRFMAAILD